MLSHHKNPQRSPDQPLQTHSETQHPEVVQELQALEEASLSSHPPISGYLKEAPDAGVPSTSESPQSFFSFTTTTAVTASSKFGEGFRTQEEEGSTSEAWLDPKNMSTHALEERVALLVNFLLFRYQRKKLITKADMLKTVRKEYKDYFIEIFLRASRCMEIVFGLAVKEVDPTNHCYVILIKIGLTYDGMLHGKKGVLKTGILILILAAIFMMGNCATEEKIWQILRVTGLYSGMKHHIFREPRELITKYFLEEEYLRYQHVANSDPARFEFLWGPRAHPETTKMQVLKFLAKVHEVAPRYFPAQYEEALQDEEKKARVRILAMAASTSEVTASSKAKLGSSFHTCGSQG